MNEAGTVRMWTSSRASSMGMGSSYPRRRISMRTGVPLAPRSLFIACSVVQPLAVSPPTVTMASPRRIPARLAGEPSNTRIAVMSPSMA